MTSWIYQKLMSAGYEDLINFLCEELTESELNSLLMEVFAERSKHKNESRVLEDYIKNRFSRPSEINPVEFLKLELKMLELVKEKGFEIMEFSPLTPFGTTSIHRTVHQNNVVSGLRRMEVVSDITNVMALEMAKMVIKYPSLDSIRLSSCHRQVRAQAFDNPKYSAHFKVLAMASSWLDKGKYAQEEKAILEHIHIYLDIFHHVYGMKMDQLLLKIQTNGDIKNKDFDRLQSAIFESCQDMDIMVENNLSEKNNYYETIRFGILVKPMDFVMVDGGLVNWLSTLTQNKKRKLLISGIGTDLMYRIIKT